MLIRWASFKNLEDVKKEVATFMPNKQNPVVVPIAVLVFLNRENPMVRKKYRLLLQILYC